MAPRKEVKMVPSINWDIVSKEISLQGTSTAIPGYQALTRNDTDSVISIFKKTYVPMYNNEFVENAHKISEITGFPIEGFQEINGGKRVLAYFKNTDPNFSLVGEKLEDYMVLGNSHDGSTSIFLGNSHTIIRCMNSFGSIVQNMKIRHTKTQGMKFADVLRDIEEYFMGVKKLERTFEKFREIKIDPLIIQALADRLFDMDNNQEISKGKLAKIADFKQSVIQETGDLGDNYWGLFNGVTHYTTHKMNSKNPTLGNFWGTAGDMNKKALRFGLDIVEKKRPALITV